MANVWGEHLDHKFWGLIPTVSNSVRQTSHFILVLVNNE